MTRPIPWRRVEWALTATFGAVATWLVVAGSGDVGGRRTWTLFDDAMISMRYARNLAEGQGLVYNAGEQVEGYTNLLWTLVMAGVHLVVRDVHRTSLVVALLGVVVLVLQLLLAARLTRSATGRDWAGALAVLALAANHALAFWTLRGMEVGLVGLLVLAAIAVVHDAPDWSERRRALALVGLVAAAVFTRDDAVVPMAVVLATGVLTVEPSRRLRAAVAAIATLGGVVIARVAVRAILYGELVPNTYTLKVEGVPRTLLLERGAGALALSLAFGLVVPFALGLLAARRNLLVQTCLVVAAAQAAYSVAVGGDAWEYFGFANRFLATAAAPLVIAAVAGVVTVVEGTVPVRLRWVAAVACAAMLVVLVVAPEQSVRFGMGDGGTAQDLVRAATLVAVLVGLALGGRRGAWLLAISLVLAGNLVPTLDWAREPIEAVRSDLRWAAYGDALADATPEETLLSAAAIGNLGYFAERPIADQLGKVDPVIARGEPRLDRWLIPGHSKWDLGHNVGELRPAVVTQLFAGEPADVEFLERLGYQRLGPAMFLAPDAGLGADQLDRAVELAF